jgi:hypothetical protein
MLDKTRTYIYLLNNTATLNLQFPTNLVLLPYFTLCALRYVTYVVRTALFWVVTQRVVVNSYRRFGTTCRFHLQGSRIQKHPKGLDS